MDLEETKAEIEWRKHSFECNHKSSYWIKNRNNVKGVHDKEVNKIAECNLLHDIISTTKCPKILNRHYSPILHECMDTRHGRAKFKNFRILLDSGCNSMIVMGRLDKKLYPEKML